MSIKAFIFDLDGTLINTFPAHEEAFKETLKSTYIKYEKGMLDSVQGKLDKEVLRILMKKDAIDDEVNRLIEIKRNYYTKIAFDSIKNLPCAVELIKILKDKGIKIAVATASQKSAAEIAIDKLNIKHFLDATITGTEITKGKPDPEIFLKASEMLNILPSQCIVVEDSVYGIEAAKRAGMKSIVVSTGKTTIVKLKKLCPSYFTCSLCKLIPKLEEIIKQ